MNTENQPTIKNLLEAIEDNYTELVELLLINDAPVNKKSEYVTSECECEIEDFCNHSAHYNSISPLALAAKKGNMTVVQILLDYGIQIDSLAVDEASLHGHDEILALLLKNGAFISDLKDEFGRTLLIDAVRNDYPRIVSLLLAYHANINELDKTGKTALILAVQSGKEIITHLLLQHNAHVDIQDNNGMTALMYAAENGYSRIVELLLKAHADISLIANIKGFDRKEGQKTALDLAQENYYKKPQTIMDRIINLIDQESAPTPNNLFYTLLRRALTKKEIEHYLHCIKTKQLDTEKANKYGRTALLEAAEMGYIQLAELLIAHGAATNSKNIFGHTPLAAAQKENHLAIAELLKKAGAQ